MLLSQVLSRSPYGAPSQRMTSASPQSTSQRGAEWAGSHDSQTNRCKSGKHTPARPMNRSIRVSSPRQGSPFDVLQAVSASSRFGSPIRREKVTRSTLFGAVDFDGRVGEDLADVGVHA